ncbi:MAG: Crp/Fnr family transcriptional regulator [Janthinobacterium lividum]
MKNWYSPPGVRPHEAKLVGLFLAHSSLLGFGTVLVYLAASSLVLRESPARTLPLAYCAGALAMLASGWLYAYCAARWPLRTLAGWALLALAGLTLGLGVGGWLGPGAAAAWAGLVGYRVVHLLARLELGSMAALLDTRPGRRLLSLGTAGELPAKALGALLAVGLLPHTGSYGLLLGAGGAYLLAGLVQRGAFRARRVAAGRRSPQPLGGAFWGSSPLVRTLGLSLLLWAAVGAGVEYAFFIRAKAGLLAPAGAVQYVGGGLAITYVLAALGKWFFARRGLGWLGVRRALLGVPLVALAAIGVGGLASAGHLGAGGQLGYFGGLYLGLAFLRSALLEPAFRLLLQALPPQERRAGYAQVKSVYEPLGLALGGMLLLGLLRLPAGTALVPWVLVGGLGLLLLGMLLALHRAYRHYLAALKATLGLRLPASSLRPSPQPARAPDQSRGPQEVCHALTHLYRAEAAALLRHAPELLAHADGQVRHQTLRLVGHRAEAALLCQLATTDPDPALREHASRLACQHPTAADWLHHPDLAVRRGAIGGRLAATPTDAPALASLAELAASPDLSCRFGALALLSWLPPAQQVALLTASLHGPEPALVAAAEQAAASATSPALIAHLITLLRSRTVRQPALRSLARLGAPALPLLAEALAQETDNRSLQGLAQVCARLATPAARQLLLETARRDHLPARAAALRALGSFAPVPADTPCFQHLMEEEMQLAQHLLHGMLAAPAELQLALRYELREGLRRLFGLLLQVYERPPIRAAQRSLHHTFGPQQTEVLAALDRLLPRPLYQGLLALLEEGELSEKIQTLDDLLGPPAPAEPVLTTIVRRGPAAFSAWTLSVALPYWHPQPATVALLYPHVQSASPLVRESALAVLRQLPLQRPAAYDLLLAAHPDLAPLLMPTPVLTPGISARERVLLLKGTALFADTPANVLGSLVPIMQEVAFTAGQLIFAKGTLGTSLFIVCAGEVGIFDGSRQLVSFRKGDFFGELALLDAEARSASAVAQGPVVALRIDQEDFYDVIEECTEVVRNILRVLCQRLRRQNEQVPPMPNR